MDALYYYLNKNNKIDWIKKDPFNLEYVPTEEQTYEMCLLAVKTVGLCVDEYINHPLEYVKLPLGRELDDVINTAIDYNQLAIKFVENPTEQQCIRAVQKGYFDNIECQLELEHMHTRAFHPLDFIKEPTEKVLIEAMKTGTTIIYDSYMDTFDTHHPFKFIEPSMQTEAICIEAVYYNPPNIHKVVDKTIDVYSAYIAGGGPITLGNAIVVPKNIQSHVLFYTNLKKVCDFPLHMKIADIPDKCITHENIIKIINENSGLYFTIPPNYLTEELIIELYNANPEIYQYIDANTCPKIIHYLEVMKNIKQMLGVPKDVLEDTCNMIESCITKPPPKNASII